MQACIIIDYFPERSLGSTSYILNQFPKCLKRKQNPTLYKHKCRYLKILSLNLEDPDVIVHTATKDTEQSYEFKV